VRKKEQERVQEKRNKYDVDEYLDSKVSVSVLRRCVPYLRKVKWPMLAALLCSIAGSLISLCGPLFIEKALDVAVPAKNVKMLLEMTALLAGAIVVSLGLGAVRNILVAKAGQTIIHDIRADLFSHLQKLPFSFYDSRPHGKIFVRVVPYVNSVSDALSNGVLNFVIEILNIFFIIFFMVRVEPRLAAVVAAGLPFLIAFMLAIKGRQRRAWQAVSNKNANLNAYIQESIDGVRVTQAFDRQKKNASTLAKMAVERNKTWMKAIYISNTVWASTEIISQVVYTAVFITGVYFMSPMASFGVLLVMGNYSWRFWQPIINLGNIYNTFINAMAYLDRIFDCASEPVSITDTPDAHPLPPIRGHVTFENVSFEYEKDHPILKEVSFVVEPGESVAIVGPTGAGKTTIVNLLSRFYNIEKGRVLVDWNDVMKVRIASLRRQMGIMLQDSFLFTGTIADNIRYGKLEASDEEVRSAAAAIGADSFIEKLPQGYNTLVTERGGGVSHGEKQLIAFARTLLADPRILILDEATSSIDTGTERLVQEGIKTLMKGRTSFLIAHRLSTIRDCTRIMLVEDGRIVECGTHEELYSLGGRYRALCKAQFGE